jgi:hypothetical protein
VCPVQGAGLKSGLRQLPACALRDSLGDGELESRGFERRKRGTSAQIVGTPPIDGVADVQMVRTLSTHSVNAMAKYTSSAQIRWNQRADCAIHGVPAPRRLNGIDGLPSGFSSVWRKRTRGEFEYGVCVFAIGKN